MDLNGVSLFLRVVETGSFTRAADELNMTTSGVSRALMRLEEDLGVRLLQRTTRKLSLTAAGRVYFDQVRGALAAVSEASLAASEMGEEPRGAVRVTASPAMVGQMIPFVAEFLERYPKIRVELLSSQGIVDLVEQGLDLAVRVGRLSDSSLIARRVGSLVTGLFASREYVARHGRPRRPADLARHNCVLFRGQDGKDTWLLRDGDREYPVEVTGSLEVDDIPSIHHAVAAGIGIGIISFFSSSRMEGVVRILPRYISGELPISLVSPSKRLEPARVVLFRDFLAAKLSALPWRG
jgi:DNA-binding transcriptional LysR family regulator